MDAEYACRCWKDDGILPKKGVQPYSEPAPCIFVEMRLCNKLKKHANGDTGGDDAVIELVSTALRNKDSIIDEMFRSAHSMLDDDENAGLEVLPFVVDVAVPILQMPGESEDDAIARAGNKLQTL